MGQAVTSLLIDGERQGYGLQAATGDLTSEGVESVTVDFSIVCSDLLGNEYRTSIYGAPYKVELDAIGIGAEEVIQRGRWDMPFWEDK